MERLINAELFGAGLLSVDTSLLVERYNECLADMGIESTALKTFHVDGIGWSPEIAQEKDNSRYLSHNDAGQLAIIIGPDQERRPLYFPARSFDRALVAQYFQHHRQAVADLTTSTALWLDMDVNLTSYESVHDLLLLDHVVIRTSAGELMEAVREQQVLVETFSQHESAWFDEPLREQILESAQAHGDLRSRKMVPDLHFELPSAFHTRAFGGVFVFRGAAGEDILVVEDEGALASPKSASKSKSKSKSISSSKSALALDDPLLTERLIAAGLLEIDLDWYSAHPETLGELKESLVADVLCAEDADMDFAKLSSARRKKRVLALKDRAPTVLFELERFSKQLRGSDTASLLDEISHDLKGLLVHPADGVAESTRQVLWRLLCRLQTHDPLRLYVADKNLFFERYAQWPRSKQDWAVERISSRYRPLMDE